MSARNAQASFNLQRILVVKLADLGDAVLATSAIAALRATYPSAQIDVLTSEGGSAVFHLCPAINQVITLDKHAFDNPAGLANPVRSLRLLRLIARLRWNRYQAVVLLHHLTTHFGALKFRWLCTAADSQVRAGLDNGRGDFLTHRAVDSGFGSRSVHDYGLDVVSLLGADVKDPHPLIRVHDTARSSVNELLHQNGIDSDYVVIHPGVGGFSTARNWFPDRFAEVSRKLHERFSLPVILIGALDSAAAAREISSLAPALDLTGSTSFDELAALLDRASLVIGADSGVVHLAAALDTPVIAIFGPSNVEAWRPFRATILSTDTGELPPGTAFALHSDLPCAPCFYSGYSLGRRQGCELRTCLDRVSAQYVTHIATQILSHSYAPNSTTN